MMKKMLTLVLVLSVVSVASAAQVWTITGSTAVQTGAAGWEVNVGDTLALELSIDAGSASGVAINYIADGGALGGITGVSLPSLFQANGAGSGMDGATLDGALGGGSGLVAGDWGYIEGFSITGSLDAGATLLTLNYSVGADSGLVTLVAGTIALMGNANEIRILGGFEPMTSAALNVVPEPITMALLGLGGLFLRRKK